MADLINFDYLDEFDPHSPAKPDNSEIRNLNRGTINNFEMLSPPFETNTPQWDPLNTNIIFNKSMLSHSVAKIECHSSSEKIDFVKCSYQDILIVIQKMNQIIRQEQKIYTTTYEIFSIMMMMKYNHNRMDGVDFMQF